jgi:predicted GNAT family N-acyltransferase
MGEQLLLKTLAFGSQEQLASVELRRRVLRLPLGMEFPVADLAKEGNEIHLGAFLEGTLVGVLLLRPLSRSLAKMRQVAVDFPLQGRGVGRDLVRYAEAEALRLGYLEIELSAREPVCPFYERLGYAREGERFTEVGLPHFKMRKTLSR